MTNINPRNAGFMKVKYLSSIIQDADFLGEQDVTPLEDTGVYIPPPEQHSAAEDLFNQKIEEAVMDYTTAEMSM